MPRSNRLQDGRGCGFARPSSTGRFSLGMRSAQNDQVDTGAAGNGQSQQPRREPSGSLPCRQAPVGAARGPRSRAAPLLQLPCRAGPTRNSFLRFGNSPGCEHALQTGSDAYFRAGFLSGLAMRQSLT